MILYYTEDILERGLYFVIFESHVLYHYSIRKEANKHKRISLKLIKLLYLSYDGPYNPDTNKSIEKIINNFYPEDVFTKNFIKLSK